MSKKKKSSRSRKRSGKKTSSSLRLNPDRSEEQAASSPPPLTERDHFLEEIPWEEALDDGDYLELPSYGRTTMQSDADAPPPEDDRSSGRSRKKRTKREKSSRERPRDAEGSKKRGSSKSKKKKDHEDASRLGPESKRSEKKRPSQEPVETKEKGRSKRGTKPSQKGRHREAAGGEDTSRKPSRRKSKGDSRPSADRKKKSRESSSERPRFKEDNSGSGKKKASSPTKAREDSTKRSPRKKKKSQPTAKTRGDVSPRDRTTRKTPRRKKQHSDGFAELDLSETMLDSLAHAEYLEPTPIQAGLIPEALQGLDLMGQARTGTGKTAAFAIPILEKIEECEPGETPVALALVPTRELAVQVRDETAKLAYGRDARVIACYGGKPIRQQIQRLREGADIIIGTPGRILDLLRRNSLVLDDLQWVVLDEADRMLDIGFRPDIEKILRRCPDDRQTFLLSATLPSPVVRLAQRYMKDPKVLDFSESDVAGDTIDQYYITVDPRRKFDALVHLLRQEEPKQAIIFTRTKRGADRLFRLLEEHHWKIGVIHGDLSQSVRDRAMDRFRKDRVQLLVATDVVGRGIDITGISHIINYDIPQFSDDYIHRVGRTGRMGREGTAYTFVSTEQGGELTRIEKRINRLLKRVELKGFEAYANPAAEEKKKEPPKPVFGRPVRRIRRAL